MQSSSSSSELAVLNAFVLEDGTEYTVTTQILNDEPIFLARDIGKILGIVNIRSSIMDYSNKDKVVDIIDTPGGQQESIFLTETGLYRLLMNSRKPIARPFQEWVSDVIKEIRKTGRYELDKVKQELHTLSETTQLLTKEKQLLLESNETLEARLRESAQAAKNAVEKAKHEALVKAHKNICNVYFAKVADMEDDTTLIKIGSTEDFTDRLPSLYTDFGNDICIFEVFPCSLYRQFEKFLHNHKVINPYQYKEVLPSGHKSNEVFRFTIEQLQKAINIAKRNVFQYNTQATVEQLVTLETLRRHNQEKVVEPITQQISQPSSSSNPIILINPSDERRYTQARGPKIQRYSPDGLTLLQTYPGCAEVSRDKNLDNPNPQNIRDAARMRTVYKDYRWGLLERHLPDDTIQNIGPTHDSRQINTGFIAMLNLDKNRIEKVFSSVAAASADRHFKTSAAISTAMSKNRACSGHYFYTWHQCSAELQADFLKRDHLPNPEVRFNSQSIEQINPITQEVIKVYPSILHIQRDMRIARKTIMKAIEEGSVIRQCLWRRLHITELQSEETQVLTK